LNYRVGDIVVYKPNPLFGIVIDVYEISVLVYIFFDGSVSNMCGKKTWISSKKSFGFGLMKLTEFKKGEEH